MRKLFVFIAAVLVLASCSYREALYVDLPGTVWSIQKDKVTTWVCFHDADSASFVQFSSKTSRSQIAHGPYTCEGHDVVLTLGGGTTYKLTRTLFNLKRASSNDNFVNLSPCLYSSLAGTVWMSPLDNNLHLAFFPSGNECVDILYTNISREDSSQPYGWSVKKASASINGSSVKVGNMSAILYQDILTTGIYAAQRLCDAVQEEGSSSLKGSVWAYNNTGYPADIPAVIVFNGNDTFVSISGLWGGTLSSSRVNPYNFVISTGTYSESGGTVSLTLDGKNESCPISGSSFTMSDRTYKKLDY